MRPIVSKLVVPMAVLLSPLCHADTVLEPGYEAATHTVKFADLDLSEHEGVITLYRRIKSAAVEVCVTPLVSGVVDLDARERRCQRRAIDQAITAVNAPALTRLHMSLT